MTTARFMAVVWLSIITAYTGVAALDTGRPAVTYDFLASVASFAVVLAVLVGWSA